MNEREHGHDAQHFNQVDYTTGWMRAGSDLAPMRLDAQGKVFICDEDIERIAARVVEMLSAKRKD